MKKVCVVVAHPDDEALGAGGTIAKHAAARDNILVVIFASLGAAEKLRTDKQIAKADQAAKVMGAAGVVMLACEDQKFDCHPFLDIVQRLEKVIDSFKPEIIYTHHAGDLNMDHRITHQAVLTACRPLPGCSVKEIYGMEVLSSTEWGEPFNPTHFVETTGAPHEAKMSALDCYADEMRPAPHARSVLRVHALSVYRGGQVGVRTAEAFTTIRRIA